MAAPDTIRRRLIREQSAELAEALGASGVQGGTSMQGGTAPRPPTPNERRMLTALKLAPRGAATPLELIAAHPEWFAGQGIRSATAGLHLTGASLVRKGLVTRGRQQVDRAGNGQMTGGPRLYRLTAAGRQA